mmetsp:Transcript_43441/g.100067  ORF Transcript_43441/g.100067 Transcript_43441/m.100067 type:complete len:144 (-) Transcript_43441:94-525(-)
MKLFTHNLLQSNKKGVKNGYPLIVRPAQMKYEKSPYDKELVEAMMPKIEYWALMKAVQDVREFPPMAKGEVLPDGEVLPAPGSPQLPSELTEELKQDETFLQRLHTLLFDIRLVEGKLVCPESGREYPVENGIPNFLLNDDEV